MYVGLKLYFHRQRPDVPWFLAHESSFSFPSGHSVAAICLYGILGYVLTGRIQSLRARAATLGTAVFLVLGGWVKPSLSRSSLPERRRGWLSGGIDLALDRYRRRLEVPQPPSTSINQFCSVERLEGATRLEKGTKRESSRVSRYQHCFPVRSRGIYHFLQTS
jgi:hypothetical protein